VDVRDAVLQVEARAVVDVPEHVKREPLEPLVDRLLEVPTPDSLLRGAVGEGHDVQYAVRGPVRDEDLCVVWYKVPVPSDVGSPLSVPRPAQEPRSAGAPPHLGSLDLDRLVDEHVDRRVLPSELI